MFSHSIKLLLLSYRLLLSPCLHLFFGYGSGCRFIPSCSEYASEAFHRYGPVRGFFLLFFRVSRCHPFAKSGYDAVPHAIARSCFTLNSDQGR